MSRTGQEGIGPRDEPGARMSHPLRGDAGSSRAAVTLREVTAANRAELELLAVAPDQEQYLAGVTQSL